MSGLVSRLAAYGDYHRDPRNVATHLIGVPLIVLAVGILTSRPGLDLASATVTPAMLISAVAAAFYLRIDVRFGTALAVLLGVNAWVGLMLAGLPTTTWLTLGLGTFVGGWAIQFVGHYYEGRKPAFLDDMMGLIIAPLFIAAEVAFKLGLRSEVKAAVDTRLAQARQVQR